jgi:high-affinity iron transporter
MKFLCRFLFLPAQALTAKKIAQRFYQSLLIAAIAAILVSSPWQRAFAKTDNPAIVIHLLDYIANDYAGAVENGKVISEPEYAEQKEFAGIISEASQEIAQFRNDQEFVNKIKKFVAMIDNKALGTEVTKTARELQATALKLADIKVSPTVWPSLEAGQKLYAKNCASCHGEKGLGDGEAGKNLDPKPADFTDPAKMLGSSPYNYFNTIRLGVPGTGMPGFSDLSDSQIWDLAFYVKSIGHKDKGNGSDELSIPLSEVASLNDQQILSKMSGAQDQASYILATIRNYSPVLKSDYYLNLAKELLNESFTIYQANNLDAANNLALRSYLEGVEAIEPKIKANDASLIIKIESIMAEYREAVKIPNNKAQVQEKLNAALGTIDEIQKVLTDKKMTHSMIFSSVFSIFLREGFESILIIIVLLSSLKIMKVDHAIKWVHFGWISAVALGVMIWFMSGFLTQLSGTSRELVEGFISLFAVVVLVYVGFHLHRNSIAKQWNEFLKVRVAELAKTQNLLGLAILSFLAVFREAFEVVLFLRAIWFDVDDQGKSYAAGGMISASLFILLIAFLMLKTSVRMPISTLFKVCSAVMAFLAITLLGKGIHSFQETGALPFSSTTLIPRVELLGIYPSWESVIAQIALLAFIVLIMRKDLKTLSA